MTNRICPVCGEAFEPANGRQLFCGKKCHQKAKWARIAAAVRARRLAARANRVCPVCGKVFTPKNARGKYCSAKCANARFRVRVRHDPKPCAWCGREFTPGRSSQIYCSRECNLAAHGKSRKGAALSIRQPAANSSFLILNSALSKIRAYLALPAAERWARRGELSDAELKLASKMWDEQHGMRTVAVCNLAD